MSFTRPVSGDDVGMSGLMRVTGYKSVPLWYGYLDADQVEDDRTNRYCPLKYPSSPNPSPLESSTYAQSQSTKYRRCSSPTPSKEDGRRQVDSSPKSIRPRETGVGIYLTGEKQRRGSDLVKVEKSVDQESDSAMDQGYGV